jgi:hypothetical protein
MKKPLSFSLVCISLFVLAFAAAGNGQIPSLPQTIKGSVHIDGNPAPAGTEITAKIGEEIAGEFNVTNPGLYAIGIERPEADRGRTVKIYVNGMDANASLAFTPGELETIDLSVSSWQGMGWLLPGAGLAAAIAAGAVLAFHKRKRKKKPG